MQDRWNMKLTKNKEWVEKAEKEILQKVKLSVDSDRVKAEVDA